jgi:16S rRNA (guanine(966)-N(2))-methyltransferase RsmD
MRIISGVHKGFRFPERNMPHARPTTDRAKEALFNILDLRFYLNDISVLDLYSGLGSIALEFASRGCEDVTTIDLNAKSIRYIKEIAAKLDLHITVVQAKVLAFLKQNTKQYDIIFADPPYQSIKEIQEVITFISTHKIIKPGGVFILEHVHNLPINSAHLAEQRKYGQSTFSFFTFDEAK